MPVHVVTKKEVGKVINFYRKKSAVVVELTKGGLSVGDSIIFERPSGTERFSPTEIKSIHIEGKVPVTGASKGIVSILVKVPTEEEEVSGSIYGDERKFEHGAQPRKGDIVFVIH